MSLFGDSPCLTGKVGLMVFPILRKEGRKSVCSEPIKSKVFQKGRQVVECRAVLKVELSAYFVNWFKLTACVFSQLFLIVIHF